MQIAGPMVAVLFLADVGLALLTEVAPALNIFTFGFPVKIMLTLLMLGPDLPAAAARARRARWTTPSAAMVAARGSGVTVAKDGPAVRRPRSRLPSA